MILFKKYLKNREKWFLCKLSKSKVEFKSKFLVFLVLVKIVEKVWLRTFTTASITTLPQSQAIRDFFPFSLSLISNLTNKQKQQLCSTNVGIPEKHKIKNVFLKSNHCYSELWRYVCLKYIYLITISATI